MNEVDFVSRKRFYRHCIEHLLNVVNLDFVFCGEHVIDVGMVVVNHLSALGATKARVVIFAIDACRYESEKFVDDFVVGGYDHICVSESRREVVAYEPICARGAQSFFKGDVTHFIAPLCLSASIIF